MKQAGAVALCRFPQADLEAGKLRPALLLSKLHGAYADWLICMLSSQVRHYQPEIDEMISFKDSDFTQSGLHGESVIRVQRLAVVEEEMLLGEIGTISVERLARIKSHLSTWLSE